MVKNSAAMQEPQETWVGSLGKEDPPGVGSGKPCQYSCLENPMDRGAWGRLQSMGSQRVGHDRATEHTRTGAHYVFMRVTWRKRKG